MFSHLILRCPKFSFSLLQTKRVNKLRLNFKKVRVEHLYLVLSKPGENNHFLVLPQVEHAGFLLAAERTPHLSVVIDVYRHLLSKVSRS